MAKRVTIQDIADELGLSRNTVSKALNNGRGLSDATRDRIMKKAIEMGYKHFAYANALLAAQGIDLTDNQEINGDAPSEIALFSASFLGGSHFASLMLDAFQDELTRMGYTLGMHRVNETHLTDLKLPPTFKRERTAAIICIEMFDRRYSEMLCKMGLPILFVDGPAKIKGQALPADQLLMDNTTETTRLVNDLLDHGKKKIGFLGDYRHCQSFFERYGAFRLAMTLAGVPVDERFCIMENTMTSIGAELEKLDELPEVFLCANDFVALDALQALRGLGYDVPCDVWLTGFDDSSESRVSMPALTTIHIHTQIMALAAIKLLRSRMRAPSINYRTVYTETNLIYRASTPFS